MGSLFAAAFIIFNLPQVFALTDKLLGWVVGPLVQSGCPTSLGLIVHALVFYLVLRWLFRDMAGSHMFALKATILFALISSPMAFRLVRNVLKDVASATGCPTTKGLIVHGAVYAASLMLVNKML